MKVLNRLKIVVVNIKKHLKPGNAYTQNQTLKVNILFASIEYFANYLYTISKYFKGAGLHLKEY